MSEEQFNVANVSAEQWVSSAPRDIFVAAYHIGRLANAADWLLYCSSFASFQPQLEEQARNLLGKLVETAHRFVDVSITGSIERVIETCMPDWIDRVAREDEASWAEPTFWETIQVWRHRDWPTVRISSICIEAFPQVSGDDLRTAALLDLGRTVDAGIRSFRSEHLTRFYQPLQNRNGLQRDSIWIGELRGRCEALGIIVDLPDDDNQSVPAINDEIDGNIRAALESLWRRVNGTGHRGRPRDQEVAQRRAFVQQVLQENPGMRPAEILKIVQRLFPGATIYQIKNDIRDYRRSSSSTGSPRPRRAAT